MELTEATALIKPALLNRLSNAAWADLGCGSGLFTKALASLLGNDSKIYAVDQEAQHIEFSDTRTQIEFVKLNFMDEPLPFSDLDGILMANALHYVKNKDEFIIKINRHLKPDGQLIIVEYDTDKPNPWVPFPVKFEKLKSIFLNSAFSKVEKIGERNSIYRTGKMYACSIRR